MHIVCSELKLATLSELQTVYSVNDLFDLLEIQDAYATIIEEQREKEKLPIR